MNKNIEKGGEGTEKGFWNGSQEKRRKMESRQEK
jgi:hypothetical protein